MRWDDLTVEEDAARTLPGYRDPAVVRTFDAPEALDTRFYEVRAKTVINRVPEASQVPFRWTINPYRGCSHACTYCLSGDTPVLMANGSARQIADLRVGDAIVGTAKYGNRRVHVATRVYDHWTTEKPAYRVTLADGTELITSADHRFLSKSGWRHVTRSESGDEARPYLRVGSRLVGTGTFAEPHDETEEYRRGYLCGLTYGVADEEESLEISMLYDLLRLDLESIARAREYALTTGRVSRGEMLAATGGAGGWNQRPRGEYKEPFEDIIRWPLAPDDDWRKGFLAGLFEACGWSDDKQLTLTPHDPSVIGWAHACLEHFRFDVVVNWPRRRSPEVVVRGGLPEQLRFCHSFGPVGRGLRSLEGRPVKTPGDTRIVSIDPLGLTMRLYDITTGTGDFIANGVVSHNCFARPTHKYLDFNAGRDFEKEIIVKVNAPEVLRAQLAKPSWKGEHIALGTNTDPYQWVEGRYKLMRGIWEAMRDASNPCSILTKSPLLLRDIDLMQEIAERTSISANLSIPTLDEKAWRQTEPHTPSPRARIEAVRKLNDAGIPTGVLIAPLMPGINDAPEQVEEIVRLCEEAGAVSIGGIALHLRGEVRTVFMGWLRSKRPDLVPQYEQMYRRGAYAPKEVRERVARLTRTTSNWPRRYMRDRAEMERRELEAREPPVPAQPSLF
jgi:DNA repair photolyase